MTESTTDILKRIFTLSQQLISIVSVSDDKPMLESVLQVAQKELQGFPCQTFNQAGAPSLLIHNSSESRKFKIILNAHLDVVPGKREQFHPYEKQEKLYGRGAYDMKAAAAVLIILFKDIANEVSYPLGLQLVTDEETGGYYGTKYQITQGIRPDFVISGENTDLHINNQAKGIIRATLSATGKTAHGAYPWLGDNALMKLDDALKSLLTVYPIPKQASWQSTINVAKIETSNIAPNTIPDNARAYIDIRFIPKDKNVITETIKKILPKDVTLTVTAIESPQYTPEDNIFINALKQQIVTITDQEPEMLATHGSSDIRLYEEIGIPGICFGPRGFGPHSDNEWVDIKSLEIYFEILKHFLLSQQNN